MNRRFNKKSWNANYKKYIFPTTTKFDINKLLIDNDSLKFITHPIVADQITLEIINQLQDFPSPECIDMCQWNCYTSIEKAKHIDITDMTAGVGGNVFSFAKKFRNVNAIEQEKIRYEYLKNNIELYEFTNVRCYHNNSLSLVINKSVNQNIIFIDPPWGGSNYKLHQNLKLSFADNPIEEICDKLFEYAELIVLKLPVNYDFGYLFNKLSKYTIKKIELDRMAIVFVRKY